MKEVKIILKIFLLIKGSILKSILLIINYKPDAIIGFGGYPSFAPIIAAKILKVPSIIHEQNSVIGRANKFLSKITNILALSFIDVDNIQQNKSCLLYTSDAADE